MHIYMKALRIAVSGMMILISISAFAGCANNQQASANANPATKTHESRDLARTGKRTSGEALQAADPGVTARGGN